MNRAQIIELSRPLQMPTREHLRFALAKAPEKGSDTSLTYDEAIWLILGLTDAEAFGGTQIILPYHHMHRWCDAAAFPLERLMGSLNVLNLSHGPAFEITLEDLTGQDMPIVAGDIVFIHADAGSAGQLAADVTPGSGRTQGQAGTDRAAGHAGTGRAAGLAEAGRAAGQTIQTAGTASQAVGWRFSQKAAEWLVQRKIACLGFAGAAGAGLEPFFRASIPVVTGLSNLERIGSEPYRALIVPMAVSKLDICPVRVIALRS